jgi:NADH-quinone oxidoreductase subunit M
MNVLLLVLLLLPLVGSAAVGALRGNGRLAKLVAMGFALASLALTAVTWFSYSVASAAE